ncbi:MAG: DUF1799 domain-containing protein [Sphingomonadaceae bacterium]
MRRALEAAGADAATVARELARLPARDPQPELVLDADDEGRAAMLFLGLETQWRMAGMGAVPTGIDYAALEPTARLLGIKLDGALFMDLRLMEGEALKTIAERQRA